MGFKISGKNMVIEQLEWMRQKFDQKLPKIAIFVYKHKHNSISEFGLEPILVYTLLTPKIG